MPLVTSKEMFKKAYEGKYAIGAFNVNNLEIIQGICDGKRRAISTDTSSFSWSQKICKKYISYKIGRGGLCRY